MESADPSALSVGVHHLECVDPNRLDRQEGRPRRFMASVFYPANPNEAAPALTLADLFAPAWSEGLEALARWHKVQLSSSVKAQAKAFRFAAQQDLAPWGIRKPRPVLICSASGDGSRFDMAPVCIRLAKLGFVVFSIDHPHDAKVVVYPDGSVCETPLAEGESHMLMRILDVARLVDQLQELSQTGFFAGVLDLKRIGVFGPIRARRDRRGQRFLDGEDSRRGQSRWLSLWLRQRRGVRPVALPGRLPAKR